MAPPTVSFPASELATRAQADVNGRKRKLPSGGDVDLLRCELLSIMQYDCVIDNPRSSGSAVRCYPVERLFRRCADKKGSFMVETTEWEGKYSEDAAAGEKTS